MSPGVVTSGAVQLLPYLGPGEHTVEDETLATIFSEGYDLAGTALVVGDANNDGIDDLFVGCPDTWPEKGKVMLFFGPLAGSLERDDADRVFSGSDYGGHFGWAMATADFDADGWLDLAVGAPYQEGVGEADVGAVHLLFGVGL